MVLATSEGTGALSFKTAPIGALIYLDGEEYPAETPSTINNIPEGKHTFALRKDGYLDYAGDADVNPGQLCCIEVDMAISKEKGACSIQPIPTYEVPSPTKPDYSQLILGIFAGILSVVVAICVIDYLKKREK